MKKLLTVAVSVVLLAGCVATQPVVKKTSLEI